MTSLSQAINDNPPPRRAFTLVEMLVVIGIIVVLVGILLPAVNKVHTRAIRTRMRMDIQTIVAAMESYKADMRDYPHIDYSDSILVSTSPPSGGASPPSAASFPGAVTLCSALVGPGGQNVDGYGVTGAPNGTSIPPGSPGFTLRPQGQVYGPYIDISRFKFILDPSMNATPTPNAVGKYESSLCIADRYNHPILYFKANTNALYRSSTTNSPTPGFVADVAPNTPVPLPFYNYEDNPVAFCWPVSGKGMETSNANGLIRMRMMLGDRDGNGWIDAKSLADGLPENPNTTAPYLIWSAGPDELFGFDLTPAGASTNLPFTNVSTSDDATNFDY